MDAHLLIVEDNAPVAKCLRQFFAARFPVSLVSSCRDADRAIAQTVVSLGAVFDVWLPDGCGLDALESYRRAGHGAPALVLTGDPQRSLVNRAQQLDAGYSLKPPDIGSLDAFAIRVSKHRARRQRDLEVVLAEFGEEHRLSHAEKRLLEISVRGAGRKELPTELGLAEDTVKMQIKKVLRKCDDAESLAVVVRVIWRRAAGGS